MKVIGQYLEYYIGITYVGYTLCDKLDRAIGYNGKLTHTCKSDIIVGKRRIKAGTEVTTIYYEMNGR